LKIKVLIADDALFMRMMLKDILSKNGFEVLGEAENGEDAVDKYKELKPDIALIDILMPLMDGLTATEKILETDSSAKVVMISALSESQYVEKALAVGAKDFIVKPFSPPNVVEVLTRVCKK
jgi:two-component system chemotaxis response regulator CheY